jgi:hypothetical protein
MVRPFGRQVDKEMQETMMKRNYSIAMTAAIASLIALAPQMTAKTPGSVSVAQEARETLKELKVVAAKAAGSAERLEMISRNPNISSDSHFTPLQDLRQDVNTMGQEIASLEAQRDSLDPWEQAAIDKVVPLLQEAAGNTQSAIHYYNQSHLYLWGPDYHSYTAKVERDSDQIAQTLKTYLKYEDVREAELQLQSTVGVGSN